MFIIEFMMRLSNLFRRKKKVNLNATQASSEISGLLDIGSPPDVHQTINSFTLPSPGNTATFTFQLPSTRSDIISLIRMNATTLAGGPDVSKWYPISGAIFFNGWGSGATANIYVQTLAGGGRQVTMVIRNSTVGSSVTVPSFTINLHAHFYAFPF